MSRSTGYSTPSTTGSARRHLGDTPPVRVHEVHVGPVEGRQVVVVEAHPLAVLAPVGLELVGRLRVLHDLVDPLPDGLHGLEVDPLELRGPSSALEDFWVSITAARSSVVDHVFTAGWAPVTACVKLNDSALVLPAGAPGSGTTRRRSAAGCAPPTAPVSAGRRTAPRPRPDLGHHPPRGARADDAGPAAGQLVHRLYGAAPGEP